MGASVLRGFLVGFGVGSGATVAIGVLVGLSDASTVACGEAAGLAESAGATDAGPGATDVQPTKATSASERGRDRNQ